MKKYTVAVPDSAESLGSECGSGFGNTVSVFLLSENEFLTIVLVSFFSSFCADFKFLVPVWFLRLFENQKKLVFDYSLFSEMLTRTT